MTSSWSRPYPYILSYLSGAARRVSKAPGTRPANMPRKRSSIAARAGRLAYASAKRSRLVPYAERAYRLTYLRTHLVGARSSFLAKLEVTY